MAVIPLQIEELHQALIRLLPPGRAMQSMDGTIKKANSILRQTLYAMARVLADFEVAVIEATEEMFCATADVDLDLWLEEYGLPDECDPFGNSLCAKVAFVGGSTIADYMRLATAIGLSCEMRWLTGDDAEFPGAVSTLHVVVNSATSPLFSSDYWTELGSSPAPAAWVLPTSPLGPAGVSSFLCALEKAVPAHCALTYEVI